MGAAQQAPLLAGEGQKDDGSRQLLAAGRQPAGDFDQRGHARGVVVGPVVDVLRAGGGGSLFAVAQVVVMGTDDDHLVAVRAGAFQNGGHVFDLGLLPVDFHFAPRAPILQGLAAGLEVFIDAQLQSFQRRARGRLDDAFHDSPADPQHRNVAAFAAETDFVEGDQADRRRCAARWRAI